MTRLEKGKQAGERWDKVILDNGIIGYIYQTYVSEVPDVKIEKIELAIDNDIVLKGERKQLKVTIFPEEASNNKVIYSSSNNKVATVDDKGNILALSSGKTIIKVKAKDNDVQSQIEITVYSPVTGIKFDESEVFLQVGETFEIKAWVEPEDANDKTILYSTSNTQVATVKEDGLIIAHKEGISKLIACSKENSNIIAEVDIYVVRQLEASEITFDNSLKVSDFTISGIIYNSNTVADIKNKITSNLEIEVVNDKNQLLQDTDIVGTGTKVRFKESGQIIRQYKIIVYGDCNGDGKINSVDLLVLQRHILEIQTMGQIFVKASNISKNGKKPTSVDLLLIQRHILGLQIIEQ